MYNNCVIIGEVVAQPKQRGAAVTLRVKTYRDDHDGNRRETVHNVEVFRQYQDFASSLRVGDLVLAEGSYETNSYKQRGQTRYWTALKTVRISAFHGGQMNRGGRGGGPPRRGQVQDQGMPSAPIPEVQTSRTSVRYIQEHTDNTRSAGMYGTLDIPWEQNQ